MRQSDVRVILVAAALVLVACNRNGTPETAVARIENRTLTMQEIRAQFDSTRQPTETQIQQYLQRWVADELLYREAIRRGIDQQPSVVSRTEELRRQLVVQALLEQEIYTSPAVQPSDAEILAYFQAHQQEFPVSEPIALISLAVFHDRDRATEVRNAVLQGTPWAQAVASPSARASLIGRTDSAYFSETRLLPHELWRVATTIPPGSPSFPISTDEGFTLVQVWKLLRPGSPADPAYVRGEIVNRLIVDRRQRAYRSLIENLRSRYAVDIYVSPSFGDTTALNRIP